MESGGLPVSAYGPRVLRTPVKGASRIGVEAAKDDRVSQHEPNDPLLAITMYGVSGIAEWAGDTIYGRRDARCAACARASRARTTLVSAAALVVGVSVLPVSLYFFR